LGTLLAWKTHGLFNFQIFAISTAAVILIMLCTYYTGEYSDITEDRLSASLDRNKFSGGSQAVIKDLVSFEHAKKASYVTCGLAVVAGLIIQFYFWTGPLTIPLGVVGMFSGLLYSGMPYRWVAKGVGEVAIGICYGWLPIATSFYLQTGEIAGIIHWMSLPVACTIFNVILINEFPDYAADIIVKKSNLVVRLGKEKASYLYIFMSSASIATFFLSVRHSLDHNTFILYIPVFLVSVFLIFAMGMKKYYNKRLLEIMCGLTIVNNLGIILVYIISIWLWGV
jgi:1,4-dihydroxy-2-naphthoate octaprenyltransferase